MSEWLKPFSLITGERTSSQPGQVRVSDPRRGRSLHFHFHFPSSWCVLFTVPIHYYLLSSYLLFIIIYLSSFILTVAPYCYPLFILFIILFYLLIFIPVSINYFLLCFYAYSLLSFSYVHSSSYYLLLLLSHSYPFFISFLILICSYLSCYYSLFALIFLFLSFIVSYLLIHVLYSLLLSLILSVIHIIHPTVFLIHSSCVLFLSVSESESMISPWRQVFGAPGKRECTYERAGYLLRPR